MLEHSTPMRCCSIIGMPEMDGYEVSRRIRATHDAPDLLLIALTGWGQEHDRRGHARPASIIISSSRPTSIGSSS